MRKTPVLATAVAVVAALAGCGTSPADDPDSAGQPTSTGGADGASLEVVATMYPLEFLTETIGGERVEVTSLTPAGADAHDLELSPAAVRDLGTKDLAVFLGTFQPAVDAAISTSGVNALDVGQVLEEDALQADPHFWLDPQLLSAAADLVANELSAVDPAGADTYTENVELVRAELASIQEEYASGLAECERDTIIVGHEAFGYLIEPYGITQVGIAGIEPDTEPSPARLREIADLIADTGATTIFTDAEISINVADALASDVGADIDVLRPLETAPADGSDYFEAMRTNLEALRAGLNCV